MESTLFSIFPYAVLFLSLIVPLMIYIQNFFSSTQNKNLPPGNLGLPIIGESLSFLSVNRRGVPEKFIYDRMARFSSEVFKTSLFGEPILFLCGAEGNKFIFSNENKLVTPWWPKSIDKLFPPPKDDLSSSNNQEAKVLHRIIQAVFKPESFNKYIGIMDTIAQKHFDSCWHGESTVQVYPLAKRYTFWVASSSFFYIDDPEEVAKLAKPFEVLVAGMISIPIDFPGTSFHRALKASKIVRKQFEDIIKEKKRELSESKEAPKTGDLLAHMILYEDAESGQRMSNELITSKILGLLVAGHDTTSSALTFIVKYLAEFPHVYDEVFNEQMEILKSKAPGELLNWDDIQKMKYSWNVACEVMRLVPPFPGAFRVAIKDFNYDGFSIPKGSKIYWSAHSTQRNPKCFLEPETFDPSRFNNRCLPFTFVPFGGGPRMCPGKEYARLELLVFMHNIVKRFKWEKLHPKGKVAHLSPFPVPQDVVSIRLYPHKN